METVTKPDRYPDYVTSYGSAYWWVEMIRMDSNGFVHRIIIDQENGDIGIPDEEGKFKTRFADNIKHQYDRWWYDNFERHLVDEDPAAQG